MAASTTVSSGKGLRIDETRGFVRKISQKTLLYQEGLRNRAEVLGCWFHDPRHVGQLGMEHSRLRVSEDLYYEDGLVCDL